MGRNIFIRWNLLALLVGALSTVPMKSHGAIVEVFSDHEFEIGFRGTCRMFLWFLTKTPPVSEVAFPELAQRFLAREIEWGRNNNSDLQPYADWRMEQYGEHDPFARFI